MEKMKLPLMMMRIIIQIPDHYHDKIRTKFPHKVDGGNNILMDVLNLHVISQPQHLPHTLIPISNGLLSLYLNTHPLRKHNQKGLLSASVFPDAL